MAIPYPSIYPRLRRILSSAKGGKPPPDGIKYDMQLTEPPLSFTSHGKRALQPALSAEFALALAVADVADAASVQDLATLIHRRSRRP